jgi:hypothetical protein
VWSLSWSGWNASATAPSGEPGLTGDQDLRVPHLGEADDHLEDRPVRAVAVDDQDPPEAVAGERADDADAVADQDLPVDVDGAGPGHVVRLEAERHGRHHQAVGVAPRRPLADLARETQIDVDWQMGPVLFDRGERDDDHLVGARRRPDLRPGQALVQDVALGHCPLPCRIRAPAYAKPGIIVQAGKRISVAPPSST